MKSIASTPVFMSAADKAAHDAASYVRAHAGDSDPDMDEALRRARGDSTFDAALLRVETEVAYIERDAQHAAEIAADIAAKDDEDDGNWVPARSNWVPYVAPEPRRTIPADVIDGMWDTVIDGYSLTSAA